MTSLPVKLIIAAFGLTVFFASPADAAKHRRHHTQVAVHSVAGFNGHHRGLNLFMGGPFVVGGMQLTDDPDPFIRSQILRADGNFGGRR
jgi:hypothetical protein